jgi:hypothetical protein
LAATASIAAGLALSGAAIVVDTGNLVAPSWVRSWFEWLLFAAIVLFIAAASTALIGHWRGHNSPHDAGVALMKHKHVSGSMALIVLAMTCVAGMILVSNLVTIPAPGK